MNQYANISKKLIVQALGRQGNFKEVSTDIIDEEESGCRECQYFIRNSGTHDCAGACANCAHKFYKTKIVYHNEKDRFRIGDRLRLKTNALKFLLYIHFLNPDSNGVVKSVDLRQVAKHLNVHYKTVINNLNLLRDYGYVYYCNDGNGLHNLLIEGYAKQREKNSGGYIVVNKEWLSHILKASDTTAIRIIIRETMHIDDRNTKVNTSVNVIEESFHAIRRYLPKYIKRWKIKKCMQQCEEALSGVFDTEVSEKGIVFILKESCQAKTIRTNQLQEWKEEINRFVGDLNDNADRALDDAVEDPRFTYMNFCEKAIPLLKLKTSDVESIAHLALKAGLDSIKKGILHIHKNYAMQGDAPKNPAAIVSNYLKYSVLLGL